VRKYDADARTIPKSGYRSIANSRTGDTKGSIRTADGSLTRNGARFLSATNIAASLAEPLAS
jgi:hypothetical protein